MDLARPDQRRPARKRIVDLFAGPGGLDVAARWLGLDSVGIEWDKNACLTRAKACLPTVEGDVAALGPADFPDADVLVGGPPCQTYTVAGSGDGRRNLDHVLTLIKHMAARDDRRFEVLAALAELRTRLVVEPLRWALEAHDSGNPYDVIVLEQVQAVLPIWEAMGEALEAYDYKVASGVLRTEEFGVPQTRRRAILIACRGRHPELPKPTHRRYIRNKSSSEGDPALLPWVSMGDALGRHEPFVVVSNYGTGGDPKNRGRRTSGQPSATVTGKVSRNRLVTPDGDDLGRLTAPEAGKLQTFPVDYPWSGNDVAQQIGNAIPPRLAAHVLAAALGIALDPGDLDVRLNEGWCLPAADPRDEHVRFAKASNTPARRQRAAL
ncbi:DNA cytosine methyltransferase [Saccharopolyspora sp. CA-218241]|uniref:DNA cytosine methyltransferase n=1 Tax=Saccharopolyspora sp. CA-218241 TaxID=3240027 RepID=UPI003D95935E